MDQKTIATLKILIQGDHTENYWIIRGKGYRDEFKHHDPVRKLRYWNQERQVRNYLKGLPGHVDSVLEVGCGFGRMTMVLRQVFPGAHIDAIDISPDMIDQARATVPSVNFQVKSLFDLDSEKYDLVFVSEVLLHIPPDRIDPALDILRSKAKNYFVHLDWYAPDEPSEAGGFCWQHAYPGTRTAIEDLPFIWRLESGKAKAAIWCEAK